MKAKKLLGTVLVACMAVAAAGCGSDAPQEPGKQEEQVKIPETSKAMIEALAAENENVGNIVDYDETTDPNGNLGRPGNYIGKTDFEDKRLEQFGEFPTGGTIEVFSSEKDCNSRCDYLKEFMGADMGILGLNQYVYKYDKVLFRVDYAVAPSEAEIYKNQMDKILNETGELVEAE